MLELEHFQKPAQSILVYVEDALRVTNGANVGDGISFAEELELDDIYGLSPMAMRARLSMHAQDDGSFLFAEDTELGTPGNILHLDSCLTFMSGDGTTTECLVLVEVDEDVAVVASYVLTLAPLQRNVDYALVGLSSENLRQKFAQVACVSFTRGTAITMASGAQRLIEDLEVGDMVLTRDDGPQRIRWIGHTTARAVGDFAPVVIKAGTLNNENDLIVSPDHRLFIYQRRDHLGAGRSELLVRVRHLVNDETIYYQRGGFVDYFQLLFDAHQIIYAEGIAAETMLIDPRTQAAVPEDVAKAIPNDGKGHSADIHGEYEAAEGLLNRPDIATLLRRSSSG